MLDFSISHDRPKCFMPGCDKAGYPCFINSEKASEYLCAAHQIVRGFCSCCGNFSAGQDGFDFVHPGLCDICHDQIKSEVDDIGDEDFEDENFDNFIFVIIWQKK